VNRAARNRGRKKRSDPPFQRGEEKRIHSSESKRKKRKKSKKKKRKKEKAGNFLRKKEKKKRLDLSNKTKKNTPQSLQQTNTYRTETNRS